MSPDLYETLRQSEYTPWIGAAILIVVFFGLVKLIARTGGKLLVLAILAAVGIYGYNWWGQPGERTLSDLRQDWFSSLQNTDFSSSSLQSLAKETGRLLQEASAVSQAKSREVTTEALSKMADTLKQKMQEASAKGETEAEQQFQHLHDEVMAKLR